jgi:hypothetical protein
MNVTTLFPLRDVNIRLHGKLDYGFCQFLDDAARRLMSSGPLRCFITSPETSRRNAILRNGWSMAFCTNYMTGSFCLTSRPFSLIALASHRSQRSVIFFNSLACATVPSNISSVLFVLMYEQSEYR